MKIQRKAFVFLLLAGCLFAVGCGKTNTRKVTTGKNAYSTAVTESTEPQEDTKPTAASALYVVTDIDTQAQVLTFMKADNGKLIEHPYTGGTHFYNKYGDIMSVARLELGQVVTYRISEETDALTELQVSDQAWEKENVKKYSYDSDNYVFSIGQSNYAFDEDTKFFSGEEAVTLSALKADDSLRICGIDKRILSVVITTGQGGISLINTEVFDGGYISLNGPKKYYYKITGEMEIEVPEGTYQLTVANSGYGGTTEITVERSQNVQVDLDTLKGEGPKSCLISFTTLIPDTIVLLDGQEVDITQPVTASYGTHALLAAAAGYSTWSRQLVVNSETANIIIDVSGGEGETESEEDDSSESGDVDESTGEDTEDASEFSSSIDSTAGSGTSSTNSTSTGSGTSSTGSSTNSSTSSTGSSTTNSSTSSTGSSTTNSSTSSTGSSTNSSTSSTNSSTNSNSSSSGSSSEDNSMSSRYRTSVDGSSNAATEAYLDTLSGIIDTLTGGN